MPAVDMKMKPFEESIALEVRKAAPAQSRLISKLPMPPHMLFFLLYNSLYLAPLLLVYVWGYSEGGNEGLVGLKQEVLAGVILLYAVGILSFFAGTRSYSFLRWSLHGPSQEIWQPCKTEISASGTLAIALTSIVFIWSKLALIPLGVYSTTYNLGMMTGGPWSFSAFCSETLVLMQILVLFSGGRRHRALFFLLSALNCISLLHGTRIFFTISVMITAFYLYSKGHLKLRRVLIYGPIAFVAMLAATYGVYLSRMSSSAGGLNAAKLISPLVYESVFSQFSIIGIVAHPDLWVVDGRLGHFFRDVVLFTTPRFLIPDKDAGLFISRFDYLSPKGAFNGYAVALLYFGIFFPIFYYAMGVFTDWLYRSSRKSGWHLILYVYISTDFFLHIMRDGLLIPLKMIINAMQIVILLCFFRWLLSFCGSHPPLRRAGLRECIHSIPSYRNTSKNL